MCPPLNSRRLQAICDKYAPLLGLGDWVLEARYDAANEIRPGNVGQLNWQYKDGRYSGTILVSLTPGADEEETVVHELCHIPLLACPPRSNKVAKTAQELAIDTYARALIKLARAAR